MIVVPVDGSSHALKALDYAISMANKYEDTILLLNIQRNEEFESKDPADLEAYRKEKHEIGMSQLDQAVARIEGQVAYEKKIRFGVPSIEIANEAKEINARCIVMGSRGNGPMISAILGSVSYGVLHLAPCPVTVVPDNKIK